MYKIDYEFPVSVVNCKRIDFIIIHYVSKWQMRSEKWQTSNKWVNDKIKTAIVKEHMLKNPPTTKHKPKKMQRAKYYEKELKNYETNNSPMKQIIETERNEMKWNKAAKKKTDMKMLAKYVSNTNALICRIIH